MKFSTLNKRVILTLILASSFAIAETKAEREAANKAYKDSVEKSDKALREGRVGDAVKEQMANKKAQMDRFNKMDSPKKKD
ncbi:MAG: hypothetical protein HRT73_12135 [Flavobacteriales bacterium]|nr:hypothetical protein [Flavobacteriales bacterium]